MTGQTGKSGDNITYGAEIQRKMIHLCSLGIPIVAWFLPTLLAVLLLIIMFLVSVLIDVERARNSAVGKLINNHLGFMIRPHEKVRRGIPLSGSTWMLLSAVITFAIFPKSVAVAAFSMLILCDTVAALVGRRWGTVRFGPKRKSIEGTAAFFAVGLVVVAVVPGLPPLAGILGAATAAIAEALPGKWDDNFTVPILSGAVMVVVMWLL
ncbi:MAG: phosphatidate cytidylyltransferase [Candidatus Sumerlaeia bacterium]|nr:phosphatidate cytidylyltransferase [Candidatus Sumerlaeia bacterium]